jgi:hypothetical protein
MELFKKLSDVCRRHYEKLILIFVLLLLAAAVFFLYQESEKQSEGLKNLPKEFGRKSVKGVPPPELARFTQAARQMTNPPALNYSGPHNLFNPVKWQQERSGGPIYPLRTGKEFGVGNLQISRIRPIHYSVAFGRVATAGSGDQLTVAGYQFYVTNELALRGGRPDVKSPFVKVDQTNQPAIVLLEVKGDPQAPTEFVVALKDYGQERVSFAPGKPYLRPIGFEADLKYPARNKDFPGLRIGIPIEVDGEPYKIVDITQNKVVVFDDSNGKRYTIEQTASQ